MSVNCLSIQSSGLGSKASQQNFATGCAAITKYQKKGGRSVGKLDTNQIIEYACDYSIDCNY